MWDKYAEPKLCPWRNWEYCFQTSCPFYKLNLIPSIDGQTFIEYECSRTKQIDELKELIKELKNVKTED